MLPQSGGARKLLLGALLQLVALAAAVPRPMLSTRLGDRTLLLDTAGGPAAQDGRLSAAADVQAAAALRRLQKDALPNFEIGVPGPNKKRLG